MQKRNSKKVIDPNRSMDSDGSASVSDDYVTAALMDASRFLLRKESCRSSPR